jgi:hypothetical protein
MRNHVSIFHQHPPSPRPEHADTVTLSPFYLTITIYIFLTRLTWGRGGYGDLAHGMGGGGGHCALGDGGRGSLVLGGVQMGRGMGGRRSVCSALGGRQSWKGPNGVGKGGRTRQAPARLATGMGGANTRSPECGYTNVETLSPEYGYTDPLHRGTWPGHMHTEIRNFFLLNLMYLKRI